MPTILQMVARLPSQSGLPADAFENVLHVGFGGIPTHTEINDCLTRFAEFFTTVPTGETVAPGTLIGGGVDRTADACRVLGYTTTDMTGGTPFGSPVDEVTFQMPAASTAVALPSEVAICISYNGDLTGIPLTVPGPPETRPQQRRRGRMYFGPLDADVDVIVGGHAHVAPEARILIGTGFGDMAIGIAADTTGALGVWSKADGQIYPAVAGYVDDAFDTQRRRGIEATVRTPFTI